MILILSEASDQSTVDVIDWLAHLGTSWVRLNGQSLDDGTSWSVGVKQGESPADYRGPGPDPMQVDAVWLRRWRTQEFTVPSHLLAGLRSADPSAFFVSLGHFRETELRVSTAFLLYRYEGKPWLGHPRTSSVNKLHVLTRAASCGLDIPASLVTTSRASAMEFLATHGSVITKPIAEVSYLPLGPTMYLTFTTRCTETDLARLPEVFFPTLFQEEVAKWCELRVFFLAGRCSAMAMFSQRRERTSVDFRRYSFVDPTRCVPYTLPKVVARNICALMAQLELDTGSLDLILTEEDRHVFLEVNPAGQFGMTSVPCNFRLERQIAEHLRELASAAPR